MLQIVLSLVSSPKSNNFPCITMKVNTAGALQLGVPAHSTTVPPILPFCVYIHMCIHVHGQRPIPVIPQVFPPCFLKQSLTGLKSRDWEGKLTSEQQGSNWRRLNSFAFTSTWHQTQCFYMVWQPNSGC